MRAFQSYACKKCALARSIATIKKRSLTLRKDRKRKQRFSLTSHQKFRAI